MVVSSAASISYSMNLIHWRIPSISLVDFSDELRRCKDNNIQVSLLQKILYIPVFLIGGLLDCFFKIFINGVGEGRWSWFLTSFIATFCLCIKKMPDRILSTGGPASAHLTGVIISKIFKIPLIVEFQDPLSGNGIGRNSKSAKYLFLVEKFIINNSLKVVYVTKNSSLEAISKTGANNIVSLYPGSKNFMIQVDINKTNLLRIIHLGSLYSTRTFNQIIDVIEDLIVCGFINKSNIELINLGHVEKSQVDFLSKFSYVKIIPPIPRLAALEYASACDYLLLIQNSDARSELTIPYKTYDYLNLKKPIISIIKSIELKGLLCEHGHKSSDLDSPRDIKEHITSLLENSQTDEYCTIDAEKQALQLINI
jgi:hypothetical protein